MASVRKRKWNHNGTDREAWVVNYTDQEGKRRLKTFDKKKDADAFRQKVEAEIGQGIHTAAAASVTVDEAVQEFLADCHRRRRLGDIGGATVSDYTQHLGKHLVGAMGSTLVSEVTSDQVQDFIDRLRDRGYAANTVSCIYVAVVTFLTFAVRRRWVRRNVLRDEPCKVPARTRRTAIPSKADIRLLLEKAGERQPNETLHKVVSRQVHLALGIFGGLRPGEIYGLQWQDVDRVRGVIRVRHSHSVHDGLKPPKTEAGVRSVPLSPPILTALDRMERYLAIKAAANGPGFKGYSPSVVLHRILRMWDDPSSPSRAEKLEGYVLTTNAGTPLTAPAVHHNWRKMMRDLGLWDQEEGRAKFTPHALRHAAASLLIDAGLPPMNVKTVMGHASITTTFNTYGHLFPEDQRSREAAMAIAADFAPETRATPLMLPAPGDGAATT